jgi:sugar phosphate isomerase/epimerase
MRVPGKQALHLTYCTNMHPGETWDQVMEGLREYTIPLRQRVCPGAAFGVGLWLSDRASQELQLGGCLAEFRAFREQHGLYVFTLNGFPFGRFHGQAVKEEVYRPDWREASRLAYTNRLADILGSLVPPGMEGSISTLPCSFKAFITSADEIRLIVENLMRHVIHLARIRERTGKLLHLGLEPEPMGLVETCDELITFFEQHVFTHGLDFLRREAGWGEADARERVGQHLRMCYDTCHQAIQYERPADNLARLSAAGIRISKVQLSSAMQVELSGARESKEALLAQLDRFVEPTYLHQVVENRSGSIRRYTDLDQALIAIRSELSRGMAADREWRVHFHVPIFLPRMGVIGTTRDHIHGLLERPGDAPPIPHWEIETYTWDVLPARYKRGDLVDAVAREFGWALDALGATRGMPAHA